MRSLDKLRRRLREQRSLPAREAVAAASAPSVPDSVAPRRVPLRAALLRVEERIDPATAGADHFAPGFDARFFDEGPDLLFFDLETTGLSHRSRIFQAGFLYWERGAFTLIQELAVDVVEERALLLAGQEQFTARPQVVSYNGRSFDWPLWRSRLRYHSLPEPEVEMTDLLHPARRRFRHDFENCKLGTLERRFLGKQRQGRDIPGVEVPLRFLDFVESGDPRHLEPILYHNRIDLTTLAALYPRLSLAPEEAPAEAPEQAPQPRRLAGRGGGDRVR